jgi:PIN domain nuclease of toxin-antitoxin system
MTNLLFDTQAFVWWMIAPDKLGKHAFSDIQNPANTLYVSSLSVLEIRIKQRSEKLKDIPIEKIYHVLSGSNMKELAFDIWAALAFDDFSDLTWGDPFDAALMAQAKSKNLVLLTADHNILGSGRAKVQDATR